MAEEARAVDRGHPAADRALVNTRNLAVAALSLSAAGAAFGVLAPAAQANAAGYFCGSPHAWRTVPPTCRHTVFHYNYSRLNVTINGTGHSTKEWNMCVGIANGYDQIISSQSECTNGQTYALNYYPAGPSNSGYAEIYARTNAGQVYGYLNAQG